MPRIAALAVVCFAVPVFAADVDPAKLAKIDSAVEASIKKGDTPGAVVLVVHDDKTVFRKAYGLKAKVPADEPMTVDTVFDMASLTKPVATATSLWVLIEQGKLALDDKVAKHWPAFAANGKADVTVEQCLLHTSGLIPDNNLKDYTGTRDEMLARIAALPLVTPAGTQFKYSDVGFITLGYLVERISGMPLDQFAAKNVFTPLKMADSMFNPGERLKSRVAPTGPRNGKVIHGDVHDPRSFALGGVAGHAGLFSTADDLTRYARMLLHGGELDGVRILKDETVRQFTAPKPVPPSGKRTPGWDADTSYSAPRGIVWKTGYGHTGFTGTSIWIDPSSKTAVIILANRVHPDDKGNMTPLRREIGTIVANAVRTPDAPAKDGSPVLAGVDVLARDGFAAVKGKRVGLVTNHTGRAADGTPTIDLLAKADGVKLVALFSPEHGIRGELDSKVGDSVDGKTGLPVYSLYGEHRKPTADTVKGIDTLVYDIQDIGCRFYTFLSTLALCLDAAAEHHLNVVVLDRPNPIGGALVEGPVLDPGRSSFVGFHTIPLRHGLTVGEFAKLYVADKKLTVDLDVITVEGWRRGDTFDRTDLTWRNPSPNMRHLTAAMLYPGIGLLETTNVSVGRGTERPFEWIGAPWIDGRKLAAALNDANLDGVRFLPTDRTPTASTHRDKACGGVDILVTNWDKLRPVHVGMVVATTLRKLYPKDWDPKRYDTLLIHKATFDGLVAGKSAAELEAAWKTDLDQYLARRKPILLYPE
jgi:uncharacterized protein YbbC (DUF1343 family)/CubicO group peptidase (beta-lactamase class C family)